MLGHILGGEEGVVGGVEAKVEELLDGGVDLIGLENLAISNGADDGILGGLIGGNSSGGGAEADVGGGGTEGGTGDAEGVGEQGVHSGGWLGVLMLR